MKTVYLVQYEKGTAWAIVMIVCDGSGVTITETGGVIAKEMTVASMGSLKQTTMSALKEMSNAPSAGLSHVMNGGTSTVVKDHGFGTGPGTRGFPPRSRPAVICTVYVWTCANGVGWLSVRIVSPPDQLGGSKAIPASLKVQVTFTRSIGSLKVTTIAASSGTSTESAAGLVASTNGFGQSVKNRHGFGTGPGTSGRA